VTNNQAIQQVTTLAAAGSLPDIFSTTENQFGKYADMGICDDITPYLTEEEKGNIVDSIRTACTIDGKIMLYPWYTCPNAVLYRIDWLEEAGVQPPKTLDEMLTVAKALTKDTNGDGVVDRYGFGLIGTADDSGETRFVMILRSFGAKELYEENGEWKTDIGSPESVKAFEYFRDLKTKHGVAPAGCVENSFNENVNLMAMEQIGMLIAGSNSTGKIFTANPEIKGKIGSVPMPSDVTTYTPVSVLGWSLNPECKNKELAVEFMRFISSKQNSLKFVEITGRMPCFKDAQAESDYLNTPLFEGFVAGAEQMQNAPQAPYYAEVKTELARTYQKLLLDPSLDAKAEVEACGDAIRKIIAENK